MSTDTLQQILAKRDQDAFDEACSFSNQVVTDVDVVDMKLRTTPFSRCDFRKVTFRGCALDGSSFNGANIKDCKFVNCTLFGTLFRRAFIYNVDIDKCEMNFRTDFSLADVQYSNISWNGTASPGLADALLDTKTDVTLNRDTVLATASVQFPTHGTHGRRLLAIRLAEGGVRYSCGCFYGTEGELLEFINGNDPSYAESRRKALTILKELI